MAAKPGTITAEWADGEYSFRIAFKEHQEIKRLTGLGPLALYRMLASGDWSADHIRAVLLQGLVGAGMQPKDANGLMRRYFDEIETPLIEHVKVADQAMKPSLFGSDAPPKKAKAAEEKK